MLTNLLFQKNLLKSLETVHRNRIRRTVEIIIISKVVPLVSLRVTTKTQVIFHCVLGKSIEIRTAESTFSTYLERLTY